jgi:hypothetical protein
MTTPHDDERDTPMTGPDVAVIAVEAIIIIALYIVGRLYS